MYTKDNLTKLYMKDNAVFADIFNYYVYSGRQVIKPDDLTELDTAESAIIFEPPDSGTTHPGSTSVQKYRDILKSVVIKCNEDTIYAVLGLENQSDIHYAMPVKNLAYDALQYVKQVQNTASAHRADGTKLSHSEFLSGFSKKDRLTPVITLVLYFGVDKWDGAKTIHEMMDVKDPELLRYVQDYRINLIEPYSIESDELDKFTTSLREVLGYIKYSNDKEKLLSFVTSSPNMVIDVNAARVINVMTKTHIDIPEDAKEVNMCKAIEDLINDSKAEGRLEGEAKGRLEGKADAIRIFLNNSHDAMLVATSLGEPIEYVRKIAADNGISLS